MSKAPRVQNVQTPGAQPVEEQDTGAGTAAELSTESPNEPGVAPDIATLVAAEVARQMAQRTAAPAAAAAAPLPTQEEALAKVKADPKHRSVLSVDGFVVWSEPTPTPFAKA
ncbi:hypothetical protein [Hydrogenophaga sp.]|uniref:hypothetical protein n=1 Tax=Hydrogenophaga sp. TaxID=1904254 RepID=UPI003F70589C